MMKKAIPFCLSTVLLTGALTAYAAVDTSIFEIENHFSVVSITPSASLSNSFVYDQAFMDIPESISEVALGFTNGGATFAPFAANRIASGTTRQSLTFDVWEPIYRVVSNPYYRAYRASHTPVIMVLDGPQIAFWATLALAPATKERVYIHTNPMIEWSTADGYVKTAPQTGSHTLGALASMTRASENTNVIQTNLLRTFEWIAEKGTSTSPPHILRCIANSQTAKPDCTDTALDLEAFSEIKSVMFVPYSNAVYVTAVDAATGTSALYYVMLDANTGLPSSPSLEKVVFSDGRVHEEFSWAFSASAETDIFYAASRSRVYMIQIPDSNNPGVATIQDIELTGLSTDVLTVQPQIFNQPSVWQQHALREERDATILKADRRAGDEYMLLAQGNTVSMCGGMLASATWSCVPFHTYGAEITAISAPTSFSKERNVAESQIRDLDNAVEVMVGFDTLVPGYATTLLGCSMRFQIHGGDFNDITTYCEAAAEESEAVTSLLKL
ncbi:MAG: hypothetical protein K0U37_07525 [Gammaproteobacteria bacterium]|nr:hypothetical protein [Gammaproteobacteria bacterium]